MKKKIIYLIACSIIIAACNNQPKEQQQEAEATHQEQPVEFTAEQFKTVGIELGKIEQKNLHEVVKASGYLEVPPQNKAHVSTFIGAVIKSIAVVEGVFVKQGQTLAILEHPDFIKLQEEYLAAKNNLSFLEQEYNRQKELFDNKAGTGKVFQKAEADFNTGKAKFSSFENQLKLLGVNTAELSKGTILPSMQLTAPIAGYVGHIYANIGAFAEPNKTLFEITDNSKIHVDLLVYEKDLYKVRLGQKVNFILANQPEHQEEHNKETIEGEIFGINKAFENDTKALTVHAAIKNEKHELIPGMYVNALIDVGAHEVSAVPEDAVVKADGKEWIFVLDENHSKDEHYAFLMKEVITGQADLGFIEISPLEKIPANARVVIKNPFFILSKTKEGEEAGHGH